MTSTATGSLAEHPIAGFATRVHAVSTGARLASQNCQPRAQAHQDVRLAVALDEHCLVTRDALAAGTVDLAQARVIVGAVEALREQAPEALMSDDTLADHAERHLVGLAAEHDAAALRRLGRHVLGSSTRESPTWPWASDSRRTRPRHPGRPRSSCSTTATGPTRAGSRSPICTPPCCAGRSRPSPTRPTGLVLRERDRRVPS